MIHSDSHYDTHLGALCEAQQIADRALGFRGDGQGSERGDVLVSEKLVEVSYLLAQIEDVFLRCSRERNTSDGPWVFLCYVLTLIALLL